MDSICCSGVKGQHDLKTLRAGDMDEILFHLARFCEVKDQDHADRSEGFLNPSDPSRQNLRFMKV